MTNERPEDDGAGSSPEGEEQAAEKEDAQNQEEKPKKKKRRRWPWVLLIIFMILFLLAFTFYEYSNTPQFCNSCHIMTPYYEAWETSSHNFVPCVDCHISPEKGAQWDAKIQGILQVMKYVTRTYSSKPYAEIEDEACLRSGCHDKRTVEGQSTEEFLNHVVFDHRPHLVEVRRGKSLRCTSCHAQIVVGTHMEVTTSTCYLCHFKESAVQDVRKLSECRLCHKKLPGETITHSVFEPDQPGRPVATIKYNHIEFLGDRKDINCRICHQNAVEGSGPAKQDRCLECHNVPEHLERIGEIDFIHDNHITKHNVTCERCHDPIKHEVRTPTLLLEQSCSRCHVYSHSPQRDFYIGVGGRGISEPKPSEKFQRMVDCSACHYVGKYPADPMPQLKSYTFSYSEEGCENCHGANADNYIEKLDDYMSDVMDKLDSAKESLKEAQATLNTMAAGERKQELQKLYDDADFNLRYIDKALGWAHNWNYAKVLIESAQKNIQEVLKGAH
jgi:hypothetical protein